MRKDVRQSGFSLLEMVVVIATILILAGALLGVGKYLMIRAEIDLTGSELEVLATALTQYYTDFGTFPITEKDYNNDGTIDVYDESHLEFDLNGTLSSGVLPDHEAVNPVPPPDTILISSASSAVVFYFLDKNPNSRRIAVALTDSMISNKDAGGIAIKIMLASGTIDLPRFIDAWGTSIRYEYLAGTAFPTLTSAGPDKQFATPDDIVNK